MTKDFSNFNTMPLPPRGYRSIIAKKAHCSEKTVSAALHNHDLRGYKADKVRKLYHALYVKPYLQQKKGEKV